MHLKFFMQLNLNFDQYKKKYYIKRIKMLVQQLIRLTIRIFVQILF